MNKRLSKWMRFFKEGRRIDADDPPEWIKEDAIMEEALGELKQFSDREEDYHLYRQRMDYLRSVNIDTNIYKRKIKEMERKNHHLEQEKQKAELLKQKAEQGKQKAEQEKQKALAALAEKEAQLRQALEALNQKDV